MNMYIARNGTTTVHAIPLTPASQPKNPFSEEERKDRYELLKAEYRMQENLPQVISFFKNEADSDGSSIQAQTHQTILRLCEFWFRPYHTTTRNS